MVNAKSSPLLHWEERDRERRCAQRGERGTLLP
jgi:hypothetical protein